jgi:hypothetical protein
MDAMKYIIVALLFTAAPISAQTLCAPRNVIVEILSDKYGESARFVGLATNGQILETFANAASGSWTVTVTGPDGVMCAMASGVAFETFSPAPAGTEG